MSMKPEIIAAVCHELNRTYCLILADEAVPVALPWEDLPEVDKEGIIAGVIYAQQNNVSPEESHEGWLAMMKEKGWKYGEVKDEEKKEHPCIVPYEELPQAQRVKDHLFLSLVKSMSVIEPEIKEVVRTSSIERLPVKYVGFRETYPDGAYDTGIVFTKGDTVMVPADKARLMYRHPDVYVPGDEGEAIVPPDPEKKSEDDDDEEEKKDKPDGKLQQARDSIMAMQDKDSVVQYAQVNYGQNIDKNGQAKLGTVQRKAIMLIDQFGVTS